MNDLRARAPSDLREWGSAGSSTFAGLELLWLAVVLGVPGAVLALLAGILGGVAAAVGAAAVYAAGVVGGLARQSRAALLAAHARPLVEDEAPRLFNLARGVAADLGMEAPRLALVADGGANALVCSAGGPVIAVTRPLLDGYTRTELEAVVTQCLIRLDGGDLRRVTLGAALGSAAGPAGVSRPTDADTRTVARTRYPPALAAAIEKATPARGRRAAFWFVASGTGRASQGSRVEGLRAL